MASDQEKSRGWQTTRTLTECHKYMLENHVACDVTFIFTEETGSQPQRAHKYVLICRSPVFEAMFSGKFKEKDQIPVEDIESGVFMQILRYMYCDEVDISGHNVLHLMYAAKEYLLDDLVKRCSEFLEREISEENVCSILNHCLLYDEKHDEKDLTDKSLTFIADHAKSVFESEDFLNLSQETLHQILSADLGCTPGPMDTFNSCVRWSKHQQTSEEHKSLREIISKCLYKIPFVLMTSEELARCLTIAPGLLSHQEQSALLIFRINEEPSAKADVVALGFKDIKPRRVSEILASDTRFERTGTGTFKGQQSINFEVSNSVLFHGVALYSGYWSRGTNHNVQLELLEGTKTLCTRDCTMVDTCEQDPVRVPVPEPVTLRRGVMYTITADLGDIQTYRGDGARSPVTTAGCTFTFHDTPGHTGRTCFETGQLPQILFSKSQQ